MGCPSPSAAKAAATPGSTALASTTLESPAGGRSRDRGAVPLAATPLRVADRTGAGTGRERLERLAELVMGSTAVN